MSLLFCDSFDHYATAQGGLKWDSFHGNINASGRTGSKLSLNNNYDPWQSFNQTDVLIVGGAFNFLNIAAGVILFDLIDSVIYDYQVDVRLNNELKLTFTKNNGNTVLGTGTTVIQQNVWYYIELKVLIADSGSWELRLNGVVETSGTGDTQKTTNAFVDRFRFGTTGYFYVDDFYICDDAGSSCNDFLGDVSIQAVFPDANGTNQDWTPSTGDHYSCIDEATPSETDYLSSATADQLETNAFTDISLTGSIKAVQLCSYVKKDDAGARVVAHECRSGGTNYASATTLSLPSSSIYHLEIYEKDPKTDAAWTVSNLNAAEFGMKLVS